MARRKGRSEAGRAGCDPVAFDQLAEDDLHLELGEGGAEAAADAAAEGDPGVGAGRVVEEALGQEALRFRVDLGVAVDQVDAGRDRDAGRQLVAAELDRLGQLAERPARSPGAGAASPGSSRSGRARLPRPATSARRRSSLSGWRTRRSIAQERAVAVVSWPATSRVSSSSRISASLIGLPSSWRAATSIERMSSRSARSSATRRSAISRWISSSTRSTRRRKAGMRRIRFGPSEDHRQQQARVGGEVEEVAQRRAQRVHALAVVDAEDGLEDDLERDRLHPRAQLVGGAGGPALDLAGGDLGHLLAVALHALAVEGRQQQPALADVRLLVEHQDRVVAEDRAQDLVALAGVEDLRVAGEDLLDQLRVGDHHPGALVGDPQREHRRRSGRGTARASTAPAATRSPSAAPAASAGRGQALDDRRGGRRRSCLFQRRLHALSTVLWPAGAVTL